MMGWKDRARQRVKEKREGNTFKLAEGDNCFRILPNKRVLKEILKGREPDEPPYVEFRIHRDVGPDHQSAACGKSIEGKGKCWLCDVKIPELLASGQPSKKAMADAIRSKEQFLVQVSRYDLETKKFQPPKPWWVATGGRKSQSVHIQSLLSSTRRSYDDPVKGFNINIHRTGTKLDTVYDPPEPDESPSKVPSSILEAMKELEEFIPKYDETEQKAAYMGRPSPKDEREERRAAGGGGKRRAEPEPEPEDEEDVTEEADVEEDADAEDTEGEEPDPDEADPDAEDEEGEPEDADADAEDAEEGDEEDAEADEEGDEEPADEEDDEPPPPPKKATKKVAPKKAPPKPVKKPAKRR